MGEGDDEGIRLSEEDKRRRRRRSWAIAGALVGLALLLYLITIVRLGPDVLVRPL